MHVVQLLSYGYCDMEICGFAWMMMNGQVIGMQWVLGGAVSW